MNADMFNVYDDKARADAYAALEFPNTYYLAVSETTTAPWVIYVLGETPSRERCRL